MNSEHTTNSNLLDRLHAQAVKKTTLRVGKKFPILRQHSVRMNPKSTSFISLSILDVTMGATEVFLSPEPRMFIVETNKTSWQHQVQQFPKCFCLFSKHNMFLFFELFLFR